MAKVEKDFLERKNPTERNFKAKPFMPRKPIPDLGHEKVVVCFNSLAMGNGIAVEVGQAAHCGLAVESQAFSD